MKHRSPIAESSPARKLAPRCFLVNCSFTGGLERENQPETLVNSRKRLLSQVLSQVSARQWLETFPNRLAKDDSKENSHGCQSGSKRERRTEAEAFRHSSSRGNERLSRFHWLSNKQRASLTRVETTASIFFPLVFLSYFPSVSSTSLSFCRLSTCAGKHTRTHTSISRVSR